jgi:hypothetical protein
MVKIEGGAEKPIRPLATLRKYSESLANLRRGDGSPVTAARQRL